MSRLILTLVAAVMLMFAVACSTQRAQTPSYKDNVSKALDQAGLKDVKVSEDTDKNLINLTGKVQAPEQKTQAEEIARTNAPGRIVSNEVSIEPPGEGGPARSIESNVDTSIEKDYKATLIANRLDKAGVDYHAKNGVLTLTGNVKTMKQREEAEKLAATVPNVGQVVNEIQVKHHGRGQ